MWLTGYKTWNFSRSFKLPVWIMTAMCDATLTQATCMCSWLYFISPKGGILHQSQICKSVVFLLTHNPLTFTQEHVLLLQLSMMGLVRSDGSQSQCSHQFLYVTCFVCWHTDVVPAPKNLRFSEVGQTSFRATWEHGAPDVALYRIGWTKKGENNFKYVRLPACYLYQALYLFKISIFLSMKNILII